MPQVRRPGLKWARWLLGGGIVLALAATVALLLWPRPAAVDLASVTQGPISETVADQGFARVREAYVVSAPVGGRLERVELHVGDRIEAGRTVVGLIRPASVELLDPRSRSQAQAALAAASAAVTAAAAQRDQLAAEARKVDADLNRVSTLAEKGFASRQALDAAEAQDRAARAGVQAADAQLGVRRSELRVARAALMGPEAEGAGVVEVRSPASGYVTRVLQESERAVAAGAPLVEVSDRRGLEAAIEFLSQDAVRIAEGMPAAIYDWGGPGELPAVVRRVEPQAFTKVSALGVEEQRVLVLLQFKAPEGDWGRLGPGYRVWGRVVLRTAPKALKVPLGALVRKDAGWGVFVVAGGRAHLTAVKVGAITDREAEVTSGLGRGDQVVVFPSDRVRDGARVRAASRFSLASGSGPAMPSN
jgi:HlyD family secretion protein